MVTKTIVNAINSSGSNGRVVGVRNMKSMRPPSAAIFFITYFYRAGGGDMVPSVPPGSATCQLKCPLYLNFAILITLISIKQATRDREDHPDRMVHPERTAFEGHKDSPDQVDNLEETGNPEATVSAHSFYLN